MSTIRHSSLVECLQRSGLLSAEMLARVRAQPAAAQANPPRILAVLVQRGVLTDWQAQQLALGRTAFGFARYQLRDVLGSGSLGTVCAARRLGVDRPTVLKVISARRGFTADEMARVLDQVRAAAAVKHPNLAVWEDLDEHEGLMFLAGEQAGGAELQAWLLKAKRFSLVAACQVAVQAARGLRAAHKAGLVHANLKPANIRLQWTDDVEGPLARVLDLGLGSHAVAQVVRRPQSDAWLLQTADYLAPELAGDPARLAPSCDVFSLGCVLFEMLTGQRPFGGESLMEKVMARAMSAAPPLRTLVPDAPAELEAVLQQMLAREPAERLSSMDDVLAALQPWAGQPSPRPEAPLPAGRRLVEQELRDILDHCRDLGTEKAHGPAATPAAPAATATPFPSAARPQTSAPAPDGEELTLAPVEEDDPPLKRPAAKGAGTAPPRDPPRHDAPARPPAPSPPAEAPLSEIASLPDDPLWDIPAAPLAPLPARRRRLHKTWDSPLLLIGGGVLLVLVILGAVFLWAVGRQTGDEALAAAHEEYRNGAYQQAIARYEDYLRRWPRHHGASQARVNLGMAQLRQAVEAAEPRQDWPQAFRRAREVLAEVQKENAFATAHPELAALLPKIAEGMADQAESAGDASTLDLARQAHELAVSSQYIPAELQPAERLHQVQVRLELIQRRQAQAEHLAAAVDAVRRAVADAVPREAYARYDELVSQYPQARGDADLQAAMRELAAAETRGIRLTEADQPPQDVPPAPVAGGTVLTSREGGDAPLEPAQSVCVLCDGVAYSLAARDGRLRWRRFLGLDTLWPPQPLPGSGGRVAIDTQSGGVCLLDDATGRPKWFQPVSPLPELPPSLSEGDVFQAVPDGRLLKIDGRSGRLRAWLELPQALSTPVTPGAQGRLYAAAQRGTLYVLSFSDKASWQSVYLGHEPGCVTAAPAVAGRWLLIADNHAADRARLHVAALSPSGQVEKIVHTIESLHGHVERPPLVDGDRVHLLTDRGTWYTFQINPADEAQPLVQQLAHRLAVRQPMARHVWLRGNTVWIAERQLARYRLPGDLSRLQSEQVLYDTDITVQPLVSQGNVVFHVRRRVSASGLAVAALDAASGKPFWETRLAVPLVAPAEPRSAKSSGESSEPTEPLRLLTADGQLYELPVGRVPDGTETQPVAEYACPHALAEATRSVMIPCGGAAFVEPGLRVLLDWPGAGGSRLRQVRLPDGDLPAGNPVAFAGGLAVPGRIGQVYLLDIRTGGALAKPYQPPVDAPRPFTWQAAAEGQTLVLVDDTGTIHRVQLAADPLPHLRAAEPPAAGPRLASPLVPLGETAFARGADGALHAFDWPAAQPRQPIALAEKITWGPHRCGDLMLAAGGQLAAVEARGEVRWTRPLGEALVAPAWRDGSRLLLATRGGVLLVLDAADGRELARVDVGQPLAHGPIPWGEHLLLVAHDSALLLLARP